MDSATIQLVQSVLTDAIKILGPALIAALATYKATQRQLELKLKEIEKTHAFGAREHLFKYYQDRQVELGKHNERLNSTLGEVLGYATGRSGSPDAEEDGFLSTMTDFVGMYSQLTPTEIRATASDMEHSGLGSTDEYVQLRAQFDAIKNLDENATLDALRKNIFTVMRVYSLLQICNQTVLQKKMEGMFLKYTADV